MAYPTTTADAFHLMASLPSCCGLSSAEILAWEQASGVVAGATFGRLLAATGRDLRWLFPSDFKSLDSLVVMRQDANELLGETGVELRLGPTDVVLEFFGGEGFAYFQCGDDDPEVWRFMEWERQPIPLKLRLGLYIVQAMQRYLQEK